jgi:hypothetical protein
MIRTEEAYFSSFIIKMIYKLQKKGFMVTILLISGLSSSIPAGANLQSIPLAKEPPVQLIPQNAQNLVLQNNSLIS